MTSASAVEDHLFTAIANETTFPRAIVGMPLQHSEKTHSNPILTRQDSSKPDTKAPGFPVYSLRNQPLGACHLQRARSAGLISSSTFDAIVATGDSLCVHSHTIAWRFAFLKPLFHRGGG